MHKHGDGDDNEYDSNDHADEESDGCNDEACSDDNNDEDVHDDDDADDHAMAIAMMHMSVMEMATVMVRETWQLFHLCCNTFRIASLCENHRNTTPTETHLYFLCLSVRLHKTLTSASDSALRRLGTYDALTPKLRHRRRIIQKL
jgi:hypothetical protein